MLFRSPKKSRSYQLFADQKLQQGKAAGAGAKEQENKGEKELEPKAAKISNSQNPEKNKGHL